jgi:uncharacterized membrane protein HdeD (DUF308 family)
MSSALSPGLGPGLGTIEARPHGRLWWLWLIAGIAWVFVSLVVLQFDSASVTTIGIIFGCMFVFSGAQQLVLATIADRLRWLAGLADILGFLFLTVGIWWIVQAFVEQGENPIWWLGLVSGILMCVLAFWTAGQFFFEKAYTLLVFAGIWALIHGVSDIIRAFRLRMGNDLA